MLAYLTGRQAARAATRPARTAVRPPAGARPPRRRRAAAGARAGGPAPAPCRLRRRRPPAPAPVAARRRRPAPAGRAAGEPLTRDELTSRLLDVVSERTGYPPDMLSLDADLEADLGIDSIKRVEIAGTIVESLPLAGGDRRRTRRR